MSNVLTTTSFISCGHPPGHLIFADTINHKLKVQGKSILLESDIMNASLTCPVTDSNNSQQCKKVTDVTKGQSTKLKVGGLPVMLSSTLTGDTNGVSSAGVKGTLSVTSSQSKLAAS